MTITEKDAEILDNILKQVLTKGIIRLDSLEPLENDKYSSISSVKNSDYSFYIDLLVEEKLIKTEKWSEKTQTIEKVPGRTKYFIDSGGYIELFKKNKLDEETHLNDPKHTTINANQVIYNEQSNTGNQSLTDNAFDSHKIQKTKKTINKNSKKSWIEIMSWIIGSIASVFAIYEFVIKRFN